MCLLLFDLFWYRCIGETSDHIAVGTSWKTAVRWFIWRLHHGMHKQGLPQQSWCFYLSFDVFEYSQLDVLMCCCSVLFRHVVYVVCCKPMPLFTLLNVCDITGMSVTSLVVKSDVKAACDARATLLRHARRVDTRAFVPVAPSIKSVVYHKKVKCGIYEIKIFQMVPQ